MTDGYDYPEYCILDNITHMPSYYDGFLADGRPSIKKLYESHETFMRAGWSRVWLNTQSIKMSLVKNSSSLDVTYYPSVLECGDGNTADVEADDMIISSSTSSCQSDVIREATADFAVYAYVSPKAISKSAELQCSPDCLWIMSGIHGEEPAGPVAICAEMDEIIRLGGIIPVVCIPMLNPAGYYRDWRYENSRRNSFNGTSICDFSYMVPAVRSPELSSPQSTTQSTVQTESVQPSPRVWDIPPLQSTKNTTTGIEMLAIQYHPYLVFDHHEDKMANTLSTMRSVTGLVSNSYIYLYEGYNINPVSGEKTDDKVKTTGRMMEVGTHVGNILRASGFPPFSSGVTRFGERIVDGMILGSEDGSVDEFLSSPYYFRRTDGVNDLSRTYAKYCKGWNGNVVVVETPCVNTLEQRVRAHRNIIREYENMWNMLQDY